MPTALVLKEKNIFESEIAAAIERGRYDLVIEDRGTICAVHAEEGLAYEYLLDLFSGFDPVPLPEQDANGWRAWSVRWCTSWRSATCPAASSRPTTW